MAKNIDVIESEEVEKSVISKIEHTEKKYLVQFKENRSFELHIRRNMYCFNAYGSLTLSESEINHPDFKQQAGLFNIKEI